MTKVSVFGQKATKVKKELKKIELKKRIILSDNGYLEEKVYLSPVSFDNVQLFASNSSGNMDIILAWDDDGETYKRNVFIGHWNDGIV